MKKLFICERPYPLYRTLVKAVNSKDQIDIVLGTHVVGMEKLLVPLIKSKIFHHVFFYDDKAYADFFAYGTTSEFCKFPKGILMMPKKFFMYVKLQKNAKNIVLPNGLNIDSYDEIYVNDEASSIMLYLCHKKKQFIWVEHAKNAFKIKFELPYRFAYKMTAILEKLNIIYGLHGTSKYVKEIEVSDATNLKKLIKGKKIREVSLDKLVSKLTVEQKDRIYKVFCEAYDIDIPVNKKVDILLTRYLYGDSMANTVEEQKEIYHKVIEKYASDAEVIVIKPHPRDKIDYTKFTYNTIVIPGCFPAEVLTFGKNIYFDKAITIQSTSIDAFTNAHDRINLKVNEI